MATPTLDKPAEADKPEPGFTDSPYITVTFRIRRFNSEVSAEATWEDFQVEIDPKERVLDALHKIKWDLDGTLTFRRSCAHGVCGSAPFDDPVDVASHELEACVLIGCAALILQGHPPGQVQQFIFTVENRDVIGAPTEPAGKISCLELMRRGAVVF